MRWFFLVAAILLEVTGTLALRMAATGRKAWAVLVAIGYLGAFGALALTLSHGVPLGVAYGIWSASGVAVTAVASRVLFGEPLTRTMVAGIALIAAGVLVVELGGGH